jgi:hypothetical protein
VDLLPLTAIMIRLRSTTLLAAVLLLAGCEKGGPQDILGTLPSSRVKFFNFGVNTPGVNFYAGNQKMTAISSTTGAESTIGTAQGAGGANGLYTGVDAGQLALSARIAAATDKDLPIATITQNVESGKAYSFYLSGIYNPTTKSVDAFVLEDPFAPDADYEGTSIRFVNAISNSQPLQLVLRNATSGVEAPVGGPVAYKSGTQFIKFEGVTNLAVFIGGSVDLHVRAAGSSTTLFTRTAVGFGRGRSATVTARGDMTLVTSTTSANRPQLDVTSNR